jgi:predicted ferric reductase
VTRARWIMLAAAALALTAIAVRLGWIADPIPKLAGTAAWTTSRTAGVIAFAALTLDVMFGLFVSTGAIDRWVPRGASVDVHRWLSSVALALIGLHSVALLVDPSIHFDALDALVPGISPYRAGAIAVGVCAMYGALVVHASFGWRKKIGVRAWRAIHFTAFAVFVAGVIHGMLAGSDTGKLHALYGASGAIVGVLVVARIALAVRAPRRARRAPREELVRQ